MQRRNRNQNKLFGQIDSAEWQSMSMPSPTSHMNQDLMNQDLVVVEDLTHYINEQRNNSLPFQQLGSLQKVHPHKKMISQGIATTNAPATVMIKSNDDKFYTKFRANNVRDLHPVVET